MNLLFTPNILQAQMMYLKRTPEFKAKFPEIAAASDNQHTTKEEEEEEDRGESSFSIKFKPPSSP
jgi:hypothetical protein